MTDDGERQFRERIFGAYANDLWISRRLEMVPILAVLEGICSDKESSGTDKQRASEWLRFGRFLQDECSGLHFSDDKQWSELMLLMDISKKYNHKSVKFCELIKKRHLIEANASQIKRLNESARLVHSICQSLQRLECMIGGCSLELPIIGKNGLDDPDEKFRVDLCERIDASERYLRNHCKTLINQLRMELDDELLARQSQLNSWRSKLEQYEQSANLVGIFLQNFKSLQQIISQLRPLIMSVESCDQENCKSLKEDVSKSKRANQANKPLLLQNSLSICKQNFKQVLQFNLDELMKKLIAADKTNHQLGRTSSTKKTKERKSSRGTDQQVVKLALAKCLLNDKGNDFASDTFGERLRMNLRRASKCELDLNELMRELRLEFGRFYFVNDLELLTIISLDSKLITLSSSNDVNQRRADCERLVQKLFNNSICGFLLDEAGRCITGVKSPTGEQVKFHSKVEPVPLEKRVNIYSVEIVRILNEILRKLNRTLRNLFHDGLNQSKPAGIDANSIERASVMDDICWFMPIQLMILLDQLRFTQRVESIGLHMHLGKLLDLYEQRFKQLQATTLDHEDNLQRLKRSAAISMSVHFISTLIQLKEKKISSISTDWNWLKLVRYYFVVHGSGEQQIWNLEVRLASAKFNYKFDFLPIESIKQQQDFNSSTFKRLINTKTSEKCFLVASQALSRFRFGASPFGPAGSGKTETIKALGQLIGCQVIVHNCDESNDARSLERLVWGLAHTGLWGCFDEFNRLQTGTLSSLSATIELVQTGLRQSKETLELADGQLKTLDEDSAIFITLNPVDLNKYRGRRQLPANLRSLFLPISMCSVQVDSIVSELLLASGAAKRTSAEQVRESSSKLAKWLDWMRQQTSDKEGKTCEWDLRLIMVILRRIKMLMSDADNHDLSHLLIESISLELPPRLDAETLALLQESIQSIFGTSRHTIQQIGEPDKSQQLLQQLETRAGVILLGPSGSGKSYAWKHAIEMQKSQRVDWFVLNPKACDKSNLFGYFRKTTNKWQDGIFTNLVRRALGLLAREDIDLMHQVWLILDGSIDPDWIECLNSVLDDNQVLTLSSGERLNFQVTSKKCIKLIFEAVHLQYASPATISRLGLVRFVSPVKPEIRPSEGIEVEKLAEYLIGEIQEVKKGVNLLVVEDSHGYLTDSVKSMPKESGIMLYDCFDQMQYKHLQQAIDRLPDTCRCLILNNFDLIRPHKHDPWSTRTCLELLRFIVSYNFYYDDEKLTKTEICNFTFVINLSEKIVSKQDHDMARLLALAYKTISLISSRLRISSQVESFNQVEEFEKQTWLFGQASQCSNMVLIECQDYIDANLETIISDSIKKITGIKDVFRFGTQMQLQQSMDVLRKALIDDDQHNEVAQGRSLSIFVIIEAEFRLMSIGNRNELLHLLNVMSLHRKMHKNINFVYLTRFHLELLSSDAGLNHNKDELCLFALGRRVDAKLIKLSTSTENLEDCLNNELESQQHFEKCRKPELDWLEGKLSKLLDLYGKHENEDLAKLFIQTVFSMLKKAQEKVQSQVRHLSGALANLASFDEKIKLIKNGKEKEERQLIKRRQQVTEMLEQIEMQLRNIKEQQKQIELFKTLQEEKSQQFEMKSKIIDKELEQVRPMIEESKREISRCLQKPEALNEIKSLRQPPKVIKDILDILFILLGQTDTNWTSIKAYLTKNSLRDELNNYDFKRRLNKDMLLRLNEEIDLKKSSFTLEQAKRASQAIVPILKWIEAARAYGQVLIIKLGPLSEERVKLESESKQIRDSIKELEAKQLEIDVKIRNEQQNSLQPLQRECEESELQSRRIGQELDQAQLIRSNLSGQLERWQARLRLFKLLSEQRKLHRFCLLAAYLSIFYKNSLISTQINLNELLKILEFDRKSIEDGQPTIWANVLNLLEQDETTTADENLTKFSITNPTNNENKRELLVELLILRLNMIYSSMIQLVLVDCGRNGIDLTHLQLREMLESMRIVSNNPAKDLHIFQVPTSTNEQSSTTSIDFSGHWLESAKFASKFNPEKIIVFDLQTLQDVLDPVWLEVLNFCHHQKAASGRVILVANFSRFPDKTLAELCRLLPLRPIISSLNTTGNLRVLDSVEQIEAQLLDYLADVGSPSSRKALKNLEEELMTMQKTNKEVEANLMKRFAAHRDMDGQQSVKQDSASILNDNLIGILSEMHDSSENLKGKIDEQRARIETILRKREKKQRQAREAAKLYQKIFLGSEQVVQIFNSSAFRCFSLEQFVRLLSSNNGGELIGREQLQLVLAISMRPLDRAARDVLRKELGALEVSADAIEEATRRAANLKQSLIELVDELSIQEKSFTDKANDTEQNLVDEDKSVSFCLAVLLHDSKKSSPQLEVDELFGQLTRNCQLENNNNANNSRIVVRYKKLYANDDATGHCLQTELVNFWSLVGDKASKHQGDKEDSRQEQQRVASAAATTTTIKCVCIANAHLASKWLASEQFARLLRGESIAWSAIKNERFLLVLIGESESSNCPLNSNLLELASLRFWHDELALNLADRFQLYSNLLERKNRENTLDRQCTHLTQSLVLLHVICQELTKAGQACQLRWQKDYYNFDADQLILANKMLAHEFEGTKQNLEQIRDSFCHHIETIAYGAQLECEQDEELLARLIRIFLQDSRIANEKLSLFKRLFVDIHEDSHEGITNKRLAELLIDSH